MPIRGISLVVIGLFCFSIVGVFASSPANEADFSHPAQSVSTGTSPYTGLNVLFIVDQSGSMGGVDFDGDPKYGDGNDPEELRFEGPIYAVDWLSVFLDSEVLVDMPDINIALLAFGSETRLLLNWKEIENTDAWHDADKGRLQDDISAGRFGFVNMHFTDFNKAFNTAKNIFDSAPSAPPGEQYLTVLVLLTDGSPCVPNVDCDNLGASSFAVNHLNELASTAQRLPVDRLYLMGLDAKNQFWDTLHPDWERVICGSGHYCSPNAMQRLETSSDITNQFNLVLSELVEEVAPGTIGRLTVEFPPGTFPVPPYSQYLRLNVFKSNREPLTGLDLLQPDGTSAPAAVKGPDTPIETYEILNPQPGEWQVTIPDTSGIDEVRLATDLITVGARMDVDLSPGAMYQPSTLTLKIIDSSGATLPLYPDGAYSLTVETAIYDQTMGSPTYGTQIAQLPLTPDPSAIGINQFTGQWLPEQMGEFDIQVDAFYIDPATGNPEYILDDYAVRAAYPIEETKLNSSSPNPTTQLVGEPIALQSEIVDSSGNPVTWDTSNFQTHLAVLDDAGQTVIDEVLPNTGTGSQVLADFSLADEGSYTAQVAVGYQRADGFVSIENMPRSYPLTINPIHPLSLQIELSPNGETVEAQRIGDLPRPFSNTEVAITVLLVDELTGDPISLDTLVNDSTAIPHLLVQKGDTSIELPELREAGKGRYTLTTDELGMGTFNYVASIDVPQNQLLPGYKYANGTGSLTSSIQQKRRLALFIPATLAVLVFGALALVIGSVFIYRVSVERHKAPMRGNLVLVYRDVTIGREDVVTSIPLTPLQRHSYTWKPAGLRELKKIELSTRKSEENSQSSVVYVEKIHIQGEESPPPFAMGSGSERAIFRDENGEYVLVKDYLSLDEGGYFS